MGGILLLLGFLFCGTVLADAVFCRHNRLTRIWLGLCTGLVMMMWTPVVFDYPACSLPNLEESPSR